MKNDIFSEYILYVRDKAKNIPIENRFSVYLFVPYKMRAYFRITFCYKKKFFAYMCTQIDREGRMAGGKTRFVECSSFAGFHGSKSYT